MRNKLEAFSEKEEAMEQFDLEKKGLADELASLKERLAGEKSLRLEQVNQKELDRIRETEQLRKEMLFNIKKTKANLLAMNDKQL